MEVDAQRSIQTSTVMESSRNTVIREVAQGMADNYNLPSANEVAGLVVGDLSENNFEHDVIVEHRTTGLQRITDLHPSLCR
ncbi:hypothetical protein Ccrd_026724 [Cynara cardunculus var. scolymus]|uniref:Uncharacterized protein n=1 Tax=Cynara cardunculus var. scolymus TaxID=59895 RepID=A0A103KU93_CYNCS|nr:hypothetical protein Ccrd_026724 [Cynara cardunculus var. scolymus]